MTEILHINMDRATNDPETEFVLPEDIVNHIGMTRGQQIASLEKWAFTVQGRVDAASEGMRYDQGSEYARDVELLRRIEQCIGRLRHNGDAAGS